MANSQPIECLANDMTSPTTHLPTNICYIGGLFIDFFGLLADNLSSLYVAWGTNILIRLHIFFSLPADVHLIQ